MSSTRKLAYSALFVALLTICSWITIPSVIPFTLQTLAVSFAILFLGLSKSIVTIICYLLIGAVGLPVFSGFRGGFAFICGPTGGFLVGFIFMCLVSGLLIKLFPAGKMYRIIALGIGHICLYASGLIWFLCFTGNGSFDFDKLLVAFSTCVLPFILPDAVKIFLAEYLFSKLRFLTDGV